MTPKEKAEELVYKFKKYAYYPKTDDDELFVNKLNKNAKQCALIAVDEMINMCKLYHNHNVVIDTKIYTELTIDYFKQVKQEIEKL